MNKSLKIVGVVAISLLASLVGYAGWAGWISPSRGQGLLGGDFTVSTSTEIIHQYTDLFGVHQNRTSTVGIDKNLGATTTYISKIGRGIDTATYQFKVTAATSTNSLTFAVYGSNDFGCSTNLGSGAAATNSIMTDINWFAADDFLLNKVHDSTLTNSSTMMGWSNATVGAGAALTYANLNFECLRLDVSGLSTTVWGGLTTKRNN